MTTLLNISYRNYKRLQFLSRAAQIMSLIAIFHEVSLSIIKITNYLFTLNIY
jgi:hypothetical protein